MTKNAYAVFRLALAEAVEAGGGIVNFSRTLGVSHQAVYHWQNRGYVPIERALQIERLWGVSYRRLVKQSVAKALDSVEGSDLL